MLLPKQHGVVKFKSRVNKNKKLIYVCETRVRLSKKCIKTVAGLTSLPFSTFLWLPTPAINLCLLFALLNGNVVVVVVHLVTMRLVENFYKCIFHIFYSVGRGTESPILKRI